MPARSLHGGAVVADRMPHVRAQNVATNASPHPMRSLRSMKPPQPMKPMRPPRPMRSPQRMAWPELMASPQPMPAPGPAAAHGAPTLAAEGTPWLIVSKKLAFRPRIGHELGLRTARAHRPRPCSPARKRTARTMSCFSPRSGGPTTPTPQRPPKSSSQLAGSPGAGNPSRRCLPTRATHPPHGQQADKPRRAATATAPSRPATDLASGASALAVHV